MKFAESSQIELFRGTAVASGSVNLEDSVNACMDMLIGESNSWAVRNNADETFLRWDFRKVDSHREQVFLTVIYTGSAPAQEPISQQSQYVHLPESQTLGQYLIEYRSQKGLNQKDLANLLGCSVAQISSIERGAKMSKNLKNKFLEIANLSTEDCLKFKELYASSAHMRISSQISGALNIAAHYKISNAEVENYDGLSYGNLLRLHREKRDLVMGRVAAMVKCSMSYISACEREVNPPSMGFIGKIAKYYELKPEEERNLVTAVLCAKLRKD